MNGFPFSTVSLHLKYIDFSKLDPLKRAALEFGFGRFFTEELPNDFAREFLTARYAAQEQSGIRIETSEEVPFRYRRFAGDATLPRGRYFRRFLEKKFPYQSGVAGRMRISHWGNSGWRSSRHSTARMAFLPNVMPR